MSNEAKKGIALNEFTGINGVWYILEHNDGTAELFRSWDAAYAAGGFQADRPELRLVS